MDSVIPNKALDGEIPFIPHHELHETKASIDFVQILHDHSSA